jgi:hypothetical protein
MIAVRVAGLYSGGSAWAPRKLVATRHVPHLAQRAGGAEHLELVIERQAIARLDLDRW